MDRTRTRTNEALGGGGGGGMWIHHYETEEWICPTCATHVRRGFTNTQTHPLVNDICYVCVAHIYDAFQKFVVTRQANNQEIPKDAQ